LEFLARKITQEEEIYLYREVKVKLSLFMDDMMLYIKGMKNCTKGHLDTINCFRKVLDYKINLQ
jgi:hypothetical protein